MPSFPPTPRLPTSRRVPHHTPTVAGIAEAQRQQQRATARQPGVLSSPGHTCCSGCRKADNPTLCSIPQPMCSRPQNLSREIGLWKTTGPRRSAPST